MTYEDIYVLIPSHSIEDFPTELGEDESAGILNAFAVVWHPVLLAEAGVIPSWHRSDEPPETLENRLVVIPKASEEWLPGGWAGHARLGGAVVLTDLQERDELIAAALEPLEKEVSIDPDLVADFLALGTCFLQIELLTTHMHHFSNLDEVHLQREAIAAAEAAVSGDEAACRAHLKACFETLTESRERFYPVECYLLDLCLLMPPYADEHFERALASETPINYLISGEDLKTIADEQPQIVARLREAWEAGTADVAGGELHDAPSPLLPIESVLWNFEQGHAVYRELCGRTPKTWGRRRFGFSTNLPQILNKFGQIAGLHIALDDGIYPDAEQSKIRWEGCDGTIVDAMTRIPLAADSATSYLRFAQRMSESMEEDQVAAIIFARWPEVKAPWFEDLRRMQSYSPCLGRFISLEEFFEQTDDPGRMSTFEAGEYLSPFLIQSVAGQETNPLSRYGAHLLRRHRFDAARFYHTVAGLLRGVSFDELDTSDREATLEQAGPDSEADTDTGAEAIAAAETMLAAFESDASGKLSDLIMQGAGNQPGYLILNPLAFARTAPVELPEMQHPPVPQSAVKGAQFDNNRKVATVALPPCGFVWIADGSAEAAHSTKDRAVPLAEENILRNEFFEVWVNPDTGGIARVKGFGRAPNRLSQQIGYRFPSERTWFVGEGDEAERFQSYYSEMRCHKSEIISDGPHVGEIRTTGDIIDQVDGSRLAGFQQTIRVWRGRRVFDIDLELDIDQMPQGDPWTNYFAARYAWNDSTAALTRSVQQGAQGFHGERFESLHYFEIATPEDRTTILNHGIAFHRKTGPRMLDSLLVATGETQRRFRFSIAIDADYPQQAALDAMIPPAVLRTETGPPSFGESGWFFHVNASNVQILSIMGPFRAPPAGAESWEQADYETNAEGQDPRDTFAVRLLETEGRHRSVKLQCFKTPTSARQRDFTGRTITDLAIVDGAVVIELTGYEIADVELHFGEAAD